MSFSLNKLLWRWQNNLYQKSQFSNLFLLHIDYIDIKILAGITNTVCVWLGICSLRREATNKH